MKCTAVFCKTEATTIVRIKSSRDGTPGRPMPRCDECLDEHKRWYDNAKLPDMYTGRFVYEPIEN